MATVTAVKINFIKFGISTSDLSIPLIYTSFDSVWACFLLGFIAMGIAFLCAAQIMIIDKRYGDIEKEYNEIKDEVEKPFIRSIDKRVWIIFFFGFLCNSIFTPYYAN